MRLNKHCPMRRGRLAASKACTTDHHRIVVTVTIELWEGNSLLCTLPAEAEGHPYHPVLALGGGAEADHQVTQLLGVDIILIDEPKAERQGHIAHRQLWKR